MTRQSLSFLLLAAALGCGGSGRVATTDAPTPYTDSGDTTGPIAEAPPPATVAPAPQPAPAPTAQNPSAYVPYPGQSLQIRRIGQWSTSGMTAPARLVIRDDSSYARFWASLGAGDRPSVDFTRDIVIAAAAGQRNTGGFGIAVERVTRSGDGLAVEVVETSPGPGCMTTQAVTQPVDVVVVAAADARTWSFSDVSRPQPCQ